MATAAKRVELREIEGAGAWRALVEEVRSTKAPAILREDGVDVAVITPATQATRRPRRSARAAPRDSLWEIIGMFEDADGPTDVSSKKHAYLADAYAPTSK